MCLLRGPTTSGRGSLIEHRELVSSEEIDSLRRPGSFFGNRERAGE
jgi:hypothetical protein